MNTYSKTSFAFSIYPMLNIFVPSYHRRPGRRMLSGITLTLKSFWFWSILYFEILNWRCSTHNCSGRNGENKGFLRNEGEHGRPLKHRWAVIKARDERIGPLGDWHKSFWLTEARIRENSKGWKHKREGGIWAVQKESTDMGWKFVLNRTAITTYEGGKDIGSYLISWCVSRAPTALFLSLRLNS